MPLIKLPSIVILPFTVAATVEILLMIVLPVIDNVPEPRVNADVAEIELVVIVKVPVTVTLLALVIELLSISMKPVALIATSLPLIILWTIGAPAMASIVRLPLTVTLTVPVIELPVISRLPAVVSKVAAPFPVIVLWFISMLAAVTCAAV